MQGFTINGLTSLQCTHSVILTAHIFSHLFAPFCMGFLDSFTSTLMSLVGLYASYPLVNPCNQISDFRVRLDYPHIRFGDTC